MTTAPIKADETYWVEVECPHCRERSLIAVGLASQVTATKDETKLGVKATQKKLDHKCGQTSLTIVAETGEILTLGGETS